jgi:glycosyltransferase involved in cell wall biosynthesis
MRILYIATTSEFGGVSRHIICLAKYLIARGHEVGLVAALEPRLLEQAQQLRIFVFPNPYFTRTIQPWKDIWALGPVFRAVRRFNPDLVSAHSTKAGYAARLACTILQKPVIFTAHGWAFTEGRRLWARRLLALAERWAAKVTTKIICVSEHDRELALKFKVASTKKLIVVHNGVDPSPFLNTNGIKVREEFHLGNIPIITMVSRLSPPKDFLTLLKACQILRGQFKMLIVGDGELRGKIERFISENNLQGLIILTGERRDIPEILAVSDIFVLSTNWEGLPRSIIEAMLSGIPVVASRVGGVPELVEDGVTGFLVTPKDPKELAKTLQVLLDDTELCHRMGQAGREKALREFTLDRMLAETKKVYEEALAIKHSFHLF